MTGSRARRRGPSHPDSRGGAGPRSGRARVLFVQDTTCEYAGVATLSGVLRRGGHETDLAVACGRRDLRRLAGLLERTRPDMVGFSATSTSLLRLLQAAGVARDAGFPTLFGGFHPTVFPEVATHPAVDWICRGEGEGALLDLARLAKEGFRGARDIPNLGWSDDDGLHLNPMRPLVDLDSLPHPDRAIYYSRFPEMARFSNKRVFVGRGCPHACTFCYASQLRAKFRGLGSYVRYRDPQDVVDEIEALERDWGFRTLTFTCESFTADRQWALSFLDLYARRVRAPFMTAAAFGDLDAELVGALASAGCFCLAVGLETGNEGVRRTLGKAFDNGHAVRVGELARRHGVDLMGFCMFGLPGESIAEAWETIDMLAAIGARSISPTLLRPYPGTPLHEMIRRKGLMRAGIEDEDILRCAEGSLVESPDRRAIENLQKLSWLALKLPGSRPLIRLLVRLPHNPAFSAVMLAGLLQKYVSSRRVGAMEFMALARHMRRDYRSFFW